MNRKSVKNLFVLLIALFISEILNGIVYLSSYFLINQLLSTGYISHMSAEKEDIICRVIVAIFALITYYFIGKKIFSRINNKKEERCIVIVSAVVIALSYPIIAHFSIMFDVFYSIYWSMCSPIAYTLLLPFLIMEKTIPLLCEILIVLLSPISVVLIWLFSKIGNKNKESVNSNDEYEI